MPGFQAGKDASFEGEPETDSHRGKDMKQKHLFTIFLMILFSFALSSCGGGDAETPAPTDVVDSSPTAIPTATPLTEAVFGLADVESVEVLTLESFPVQINLIVGGVLPNGCTVIDKSVVQRDGDMFNVAVTVVQEPGQTCTEAEVPFEETVPLDVLGLEAGTYSVTVNGVQDSFTLDVDNVIQEDPAGSAVGPSAAPTDAATATINGIVWHDLCVSGDEDTELTAGCVAMAEGSIQANGVLESEPGIEGVRVAIGDGQCPAVGVGLAVTDAQGNYRISNLTPGTYCISIDATEEQNQEILSTGKWTMPASGIAEVTVTLDEGDALQTANFGWDYDSLPDAPPAEDIDLANCSNSFEFVEDLNIPDDTQFSPGETFTKRWRLRNNGTCPWSTEYSIVFVGGDQMSAEELIPLIQPVSVGQAMEVAVPMIAPDEPGTYRGNWQLAGTDGEPFGIDGNIEDAFWLRIEVTEDATPTATALPNSGTIGGVVWEDFCINSNPGAGCVEFPEDSLIFIGDGTYDAGESPLSGITISLASGVCALDGTLPPASAILSTTVTDADGLYRFENLDEGTYCVFMDALSEENVDFLIPGNWTWPAAGVGRYTFVLDPGEQALDLDFGWDFVD